jgi:hypothetical protein
MSYFEGYIVGVIRHTYGIFHSEANAIREQPRYWVLPEGSPRYCGCPAPKPAFAETLETEHKGHDPCIDDEITIPNPTFTQEHAWNGECEGVRASAGSNVQFGVYSFVNITTEWTIIQYITLHRCNDDL